MLPRFMRKRSKYKISAEFGYRCYKGKKLLPHNNRTQLSSLKFVLNKKSPPSARYPTYLACIKQKHNMHLRWRNGTDAPHRPKGSAY